MDPEVANRLIQYLRNAEYPPNFDKDQKRDLRKKAQSYIYREEVLYHQVDQTKQPRRVVIGNEEKLKILQQVHCGLVGGAHFGIVATR